MKTAEPAFTPAARAASGLGTWKTDELLSGLIASLLFGGRPIDVPTAAAVAGTMIIVAAVACLLPAWRASRLDPIAALRGD